MYIKLSIYRELTVKHYNIIVFTKQYPLHFHKPFYHIEVIFMVYKSSLPFKIKT